MSKSHRRLLIFLLVFLTVGMAVKLINDFLLALPTPLESCIKKCKEYNRKGVLTYKGPDTPKSFYKSMHSDCECQ